MGALTQQQPMDTSSSSNANHQDALAGNGQQQNQQDMASNTVKMSKTLLCEIKVRLCSTFLSTFSTPDIIHHPVLQGTMNAFSVMGPSAATWKPVEGKHVSIFGMEDTIGMSSAAGANGEDAPGTGSSMMLNADLAAAHNSLRNVTITKATILQTYNTFGVPLGVTVNCLPRNEVVDTGDKYTFTTIPNSSVNSPFTLYEAGESHKQAMEWRTNYGKFTAYNLTTQDVLDVPNCPFLFVHENHPVVNLLRINKHIVGVDIDDQPRMDGQWLKITKNLFDSSCDTIRNRILSKIHTQDLTNISVSFFFSLKMLYLGH